MLQASQLNHKQEIRCTKFQYKNAKRRLLKFEHAFTEEIVLCEYLRMHQIVQKQEMMEMTHKMSFVVFYRDGNFRAHPRM